MTRSSFSDVIGGRAAASSSGRETPEDRLKAMGLELPAVASGVGDYEPWIELNGVIYTSGQLPWVDGVLRYTGKLGDKLTVEDGYQSFRLSALNAIAQLKSAAGELSRIKRIVRVEGSLQAVDGFVDHPKALDGASQLINEVFGERGRHTRMVYCDPSMALDCTTLIVLWAEIER